MCGQPFKNDPENMTERLLALANELAAELHQDKRPMLTLDSSLDRDVGLDSLSRLELLGRIEDAFDVSLSEQAFSGAETIRDVLRAVHRAEPARGPGIRVDSSTETWVDRGSPKADDRLDAVVAPDAAGTLLDVLHFHAERHYGRTHIRFYQDDGNGAALTYGGLDEAAKRVAAGLLIQDLERDDTVAIMLPPGREYFASYFGALLAGAVPVPLYPPARPSKIEEHLRRQVVILNNCRAKILITVREALRFAELLRPHVESLRQVVTTEDLGSAEAMRAGVVVNPQDTALIQYTSGSTGDPKGVVLTHANLLANVRAIGGAVRMSPADVGVSWLPLYHDMGLIGGWFCSLYYALPLVVMSPFDFLSRPERWLKAIHRHRATLSVAPNFAYEMCVHRIKDEDIEGLDLGSWRVAFNGAEPVNPDTIDRFCERFGGYGFKREAMMPVYGLAESTVALAFTPYGRGPVVDRIDRERLARDGRAVAADSGDPSALRIVSCGRPLPGHEIRIVDAASHELPDGHEGRLHFRGPSATSGYFRNAEATRTLFEGAWLNSGDLAYVSNGEVYITGRSKDMIIRAGRNIYPHEIEAAVGDLSGVRKGNVVAFGTADRDAGTERLVVVAETRSGDPASHDGVRAAILGAVTDIVGSPPDDIVLVRRGAIPKTTSGKVRRAASRELYERGKIGQRQRTVWGQMAGLALSTVRARMRRLVRRTGEVAYTAYVLVVAAVFVALSWIPVALGPGLSSRWAVVRWASRTMWRLAGAPLLIKGAENVPRDGRYIIVSNHASYIDSFVLAAALPMNASFVAKSELKRNPVVHHYLRRLGVEFIDRWDKEQRDEDTQRIKERAREGCTLLFFAEGGMSRRPGLRPFKMGAFIAAAEGGVPIVPVAIRGTRSMLRPDTYTLRRNVVTVSIGPPIDPLEPHGRQAPADSWTLALSLRGLTRDFILRHCGEPDLGDEPR